MLEKTQSSEDVDTVSKGDRTGESGDSGPASAPPLPSIPLSPKDRNDVDGLVEAMGRLYLQLALLDTEYSERFYGLLSLYCERIAKLVAQRKPIEDTAKDFCEAINGEFAKKRSPKVSFRASKKIVVPKGKEEIVITTLLALQLTDCVRIIQESTRRP